MNPLTIISQASAEGVILTLSASGAIKATGNPAQVEKWLPVVRDNKPALIDYLQGEALVLAWLDRIEENDPVIIREVIEKCRGDQDARTYYIGRANDRGKR